MFLKIITLVTKIGIRMRPVCACGLILMWATTAILPVIAQSKKSPSKTAVAVPKRVQVAVARRTSAKPSSKIGQRASTVAGKNNASAADSGDARVERGNDLQAEIEAERLKKEQALAQLDVRSAEIENLRRGVEADKEALRQIQKEREKLIAEFETEKTRLVREFEAEKEKTNRLRRALIEAAATRA